MRLVATALFVLLASAVWAQSPLLPHPPDVTPAATSTTPAEASFQAYGDRDKTCAEWTDTCRTCRRTDTGLSCSNIGPTCQPAAITCTRQVGAPVPIPPAPAPTPAPAK